MACFFFFLWVLIFASLTGPAAIHAQQPTTCEGQLAETQATLAFVRASRQQSEENAGHVMATLQKRLEEVLKDIDTLKHAPIAAPDPPAATPKEPGS